MKYGVVVTDSDGRRVVSSRKSRSPGQSTLSTGIYLFQPEVIEMIPPNCELISAVFNSPVLVEKGIPFYAQQQSFNWIDISRLTDYWDVLLVLRGEVTQMHMPGKEGAACTCGWA